MKSFVIALVVAAAAAGPALANECPTLQAQIDAALSRRSDPNATIAKQLAAQAWALHQAGQHTESVAKYDEAARAAGITLRVVSVWLGVGHVAAGMHCRGFDCNRPSTRGGAGGRPPTRTGWGTRRGA